MDNPWLVNAAETRLKTSFASLFCYPTIAKTAPISFSLKLKLISIGVVLKRTYLLKKLRDFHGNQVKRQAEAFFSWKL